MANGPYSSYPKFGLVIGKLKYITIRYSGSQVGPTGRASIPCHSAKEEYNKFNKKQTLLLGQRSGNPETKEQEA